MRDWGETLFSFGLLLIVGSLALFLSVITLAFLISAFTNGLYLLGFVPLLGLALMVWKIVVDVFWIMVEA